VIDSNEVIRSYLAADPGLIALVGAKIYCPRIPENIALPAIGFFTRGGVNNPHIPPLLNPSKQFDCWGSSPIIARQVYRALFDSLQGIQNVKVTIGAIDYYILSAIEEVQGQDLADSDVQNYFRVLTFYQIMVR